VRANNSTNHTISRKSDSTTNSTTNNYYDDSFQYSVSHPQSLSSIVRDFHAFMPYRNDRGLPMIFNEMKRRRYHLNESYMDHVRHAVGMIVSIEREQSTSNKPNSDNILIHDINKKEKEVKKKRKRDNHQQDVDTSAILSDDGSDNNDRQSVTPTSSISGKSKTLKRQSKKLSTSSSSSQNSKSASLVNQSDFNKKRRTASSNNNNKVAQLSGRWTDKEDKLFITALATDGRDMDGVVGIMKTRTLVQINKHLERQDFAMAGYLNNWDWKAAGKMLLKYPPDVIKKKYLKKGGKILSGAAILRQEIHKQNVMMRKAEDAVEVEHEPKRDLGGRTRVVDYDRITELINDIEDDSADDDDADCDSEYSEDQTAAENRPLSSLKKYKKQDFISTEKQSHAGALLLEGRKSSSVYGYDELKSGMHESVVAASTSSDDEEGEGEEEDDDDESNADIVEEEDEDDNESNSSQDGGMMSGFIDD